MATLASDWIEATRRHLLGTTRDEQDTLASAVSSTSATTLVVSAGAAGIAAGAGALLSIDTEDVYVTGYDSTTKTATVIRGVRGSTAATHANGATVYVNPRYTNFAVLAELNNELGDLSSPLNGLFQVKSLDLTYNPAIDGYDLTGVTSFLDVWRLNYKATGSARRWPPIRYFRVERNLPTTEFASGTAIVLNETAQPGNAIRVRYKTGYSALATTTTDVSTTGLHTEAWDIPVMGAAIRLAAGAEITRNALTAAPSARRAEEVPAGAETAAATALRALRAARIQAEAARLSRQYPEEMPT